MEFSNITEVKVAVEYWESIWYTTESWYIRILIIRIPPLFGNHGAAFLYQALYDIVESNTVRFWKTRSNIKLTLLDTDVGLSSDLTHSIRLEISLINSSQFQKRPDILTFVQDVQRWWIHHLESMGSKLLWSYHIISFLKTFPIYVHNSSQTNEYLSWTGNHSVLIYRQQNILTFKYSCYLKLFKITTFPPRKCVHWLGDPPFLY